jgi:hypothetical protein
VLLRDEEWAGWSNVKIANSCGVDDKTVASVRADLSSEVPRIATRTVERGGTTYAMNTAAIGRAPAVRAELADELPAPAPDPEAEAVRALFASTFRKPADVRKTLTMVKVSGALRARKAKAQCGRLEDPLASARVQIPTENARGPFLALV